MTRLLIVSALALAVSPPVLSQPDQQEPGRIQVVVMGTFHFGATTDANRHTFSDLFSERRQRELGEIRARLASFGPDRVFVENEPSRQAHWDSVYAAYQRGVLPEGNDLRNEIFQIGVKLADTLGLPGVTCMDYRIPNISDPDWTPRSASEARYAEYLRATYDALDDSLGKTNEPFFMLRQPRTETRGDSLLQALPLRDYYLRLNAPDVVRAYDYGDFNHWAFAFGEGSEHVGADFVANYTVSRHLKMYQNVLRHASLSDDRYLVLVGASHAEMLKQWFESHPYFEVIEVADVLGP